MHSLVETSTSYTTPPAPDHQSPTPASIYDRHHLIPAVHAISSAGRLPFVLMVNSAYVPLTLNWLCNVRTLVPDISAQLIVIASDMPAAREIATRGRHPVFFLPVEDGEYTSKLEWDKPLYRRYLLLRVGVNNQILRANVSFVQVETDALWLRDPREILGDRGGGADVVAARLGGHALYKQEMKSVNFILIRATAAARRMWQKLEEVLTESLGTVYEQNVLDDLCRKRHANVTCAMFRWDEVSDGNWYKVLTPAQRASFIPYVINNNFIVGVEQKMERARKFGHWFLTAEQTCDHQALAELREWLTQVETSIRSKAENRSEMQFFTN